MNLGQSLLTAGLLSLSRSPRSPRSPSPRPGYDVMFTIGNYRQIKKRAGYC